MNALLLLDIHKSWAWFVIVSNGLAGLWSLGAHRWPSLRSRALWWFTGGAEATILVQVIFGITLLNHYKLHAPKFHMFYGFVAFITVGLLYSYRYVFRARNQLELFYGLGGLFMMGLGIRAILQVA